MQYDVNRIEFVKTQKTKYVMQTSEYIFKICIGCIVHIYIFLKIICSLCPDMFCEMFYLLRCFAFAEIKCFCVCRCYIFAQSLSSHSFYLPKFIYSLMYHSPTHSFRHSFPSHSFHRSQPISFTFNIFGFTHTTSYFNLIVSFIF